jgi:hypothetical protein
MTINGGRRTLQDRRLPELSSSKRIAKARTSNQNTTFSTESTHRRRSHRRHLKVGYWRVKPPVAPTGDSSGSLRHRDRGNLVVPLPLASKCENDASPGAPRRLAARVLKLVKRGNRHSWPDTGQSHESGLESVRR